MGADECFELLPICVGLEFEVCVIVDEKVGPGVLVDLVDGHMAEGAGGECGLPAGAGEEVTAGMELCDKRVELGGIPPELGQISDDLINMGESFTIVSALCRDFSG